MRRIDFFIIGVQKGGTTALDSYLRQSPFVQLPAVKEIHFFDDETVDWSDVDYRSFHAHFEWFHDLAVVRGEATPIYIYWPNAMERLRLYNPAAKLIACLRHPSYRAYSHWRMSTARAAETMPFEDAISEAGRRRVRNAPGDRVYSYVERGFYAWQVRRLQEFFPSDQLLFLRTDDLWTRLEHTLSRINGFLNIGPTPVERTYVTPYRHSDDSGAIPAAALAALNDLFEADIHETSRLTGVFLSDWLEPTYREPTVRT